MDDFIPHVLIAAEGLYIRSRCVLCSVPAAVHDRDPDSTGLAQGCVCNLGSGEKGVCVLLLLLHACHFVCTYVRMCTTHIYVAVIVLSMQKVVSDLQKEISEQQQKQDRVVRQTTKLQKEIRAKKGTLEATGEEVCMYMHTYIHTYIHVHMNVATYLLCIFSISCANIVLITACCVARNNETCH